MPDGMRFPHEIHDQVGQTNNEFLEAHLKVYAAIAYRTAIQGIPSGVFTRVALDTASYDPGKLFDLATGSYIVPADGLYQVNGNALLKIPVPAAGEYNTVAKIYVNGVPRVAGPFMEKIGKEFIGYVVSGLVRCKKRDKIELMIYQASGVEHKTLSSGEYNQMSVFRV